MQRSGGTSESAEVLPGHSGLEQPLQRLPTGGSGRPVALTIAMAVLVAALVVQPWGWGQPTIAQSATPGSTNVALGERSSPAPPAPTPGRAADGGLPGPASYGSLVDNEWPVVAMLAPQVLASSEEPATSHGILWSVGEPLLVLQQGLSYTVEPLGGLGSSDPACHAPGGPRDRNAVDLPVRRVAYLGVTFPGMDPRARVTPAILDLAGTALHRLPSVVVQLEGMIDGQLYTVPSSGPGGTVLFATSPPGILPSATYQFDIQLPGIVGHRYLYACIGR